MTACFLYIYPDWLSVASYPALRVRARAGAGQRRGPRRAHLSRPGLGPGRLRLPLVSAQARPSRDAGPSTISGMLPPIWHGPPTLGYTSSYFITLHMLAVGPTSCCEALASASPGFARVRGTSGLWPAADRPPRTAALVHEKRLAHLRCRRGLARTSRRADTASEVMRCVFAARASCRSEGSEMRRSSAAAQVSVLGMSCSTPGEASFPRMLIAASGRASLECSVSPPELYMSMSRTRRRRNAAIPGRRIFTASPRRVPGPFKHGTNASEPVVAPRTSWQSSSPSQTPQHTPSRSPPRTVTDSCAHPAITIVLCARRNPA